MARRVTPIIASKMPNAGCKACSGMGTVRLTAHFAAGDHEWEWPCWECFGHEVRLPLPRPK
jgi:DnaJ-class molecular chaperone